MKKLISVLKATMTGDMNIFQFTINRKTTIFKKIRNTILAIFLLVLLLFSSGQYAYLIAEPLHKLNLTYIMLTLFMLATTLIVFMEGIYKSQGILFDAKDSDLLFSMPIKRRVILTARLIKLIAFQYIFNLIISVPAIAVYAFFEKPQIDFYLISLTMLILVPIIPTIIACIFGYIIKALSSIFKKKNLVQFILSTIFAAGLLTLSFKTQTFITQISEKATSINDFITKIYYPIGLYIDCIQSFDITKFIILIGINLIAIILYILIFSMLYFKIVSKFSETTSKSNYSFKNRKFKRNNQLKALILKELKRYFGSFIYVFNTIFGVIIVLIFAISIGINFNGTFEFIAATEGITIPTEQILSIFPKIYICLLMFTIPTIAITASSISLEGKSFDFTKSLPVTTKKVFLSKILFSDIISIPVLLLSTIFLIIRLKFGLIDSIISILTCLIIPNIVAILGLIINLTFPLLNAKSDTVVVKQSLSSMIAIFGGLIIGMLPIIIYFAFKIKLDIDLYTISASIIYAIIAALLFYILMNYGIRKYKQLNN